MLEWFKRRGQRPKSLAELTPDELDAVLDGHPELAHLLRHTLGVMQFAPVQTADAVLERVSRIIDEVLRRKLSPEDERAYVAREMEALRRMLLAPASPDAGPAARPDTPRR